MLWCPSQWWDIINVSLRLYRNVYVVHVGMWVHKHGRGCADVVVRALVGLCRGAAFCAGN